MPGAEMLTDGLYLQNSKYTKPETFNENTQNQNFKNLTSDYIPDLRNTHDHFKSGNVDNNYNETFIFPSDNFIPDDEIETILSRDDVKSFLGSIPDSIAREASRLHIKYCPFTSLCNFSVDFKSNLFTKDCCVPCSCSSSCEITGNCCPDYQSGKYFGNIRRDNYQGNCQHAALVDESQISLPGDRYYFFISECPFRSNELEINACVRPKRPTALEGFLDIIPVTDKSKRINYKTRHRATCNNISARNLTYRRVVLQCTIDVSSEAQNLNTIMQFIDGDQCNLLYNPEDDVGHKTTVCTPMVTKCNLTGKWRGNSVFSALPKEHSQILLLEFPLVESE
ncbi:hypothetical protein CHS0354_041124 [Potamilus streckersoni]|uniref:Uncharacterized protein n=1 Tax=Potamilus streckersoni TaxID=2493646 RepID=A0AAE0SDV4_9BIVA|nr:hypothetical protein CHS0354_041124 [Potamilus streckersoni]